MEEGYQKVEETIKLYPKQIIQAYDEINKISLPEEYNFLTNIIFCGMGGSALGARVVDSLLIGELKIPLEIFTEYHLPEYTNENSLVIVSSYSGNTEETIYCATQALNKNAKLFGITTGGQLEELLKKNNVPCYLINPINNPSGQPRMALGYSISATLALFSKTGLINLPKQEIENSIDQMIQFLNSDNSTIINELTNKIPVIIASEHLTGIAHAFKNQLNENAKTFALLFDIPELNHHLMEGLSYPSDVKKYLRFIFLQSQLYSERVQKRYPLTKEVVEKNDITTSTYNCLAKTKLDQVFEILLLGSKISLELAKKNNVDITSIPWVDYFKEQLAKP